LTAQPLAELDGVIPGHIHDGMIVGLNPAGVPPRELGVTMVERGLVAGFVARAAQSVPFRFRFVITVVDELAKLPQRDFVDTQVKRPGDPHAMSG
jgi:hypothetical protein